MKIRQYEVWKAKPPGFERAHWFVIASPPEICESDRVLNVNGLVCLTLRGEPKKTDVRLNGADGFDHATVCACDFFYALKKSELHDGLGAVSLERRGQVARRVREVFRLG